MHATIRAIEYFLPDGIVGNDALAREFPAWTPEKIEEKLGIAERHVAAPGECSSDLGVEAARRLLARGVCAAADVDYLLLCTQSPDYFLPTTACVMQERLGLPRSAGALDFNLGCSGYVYGLGLAKGLIETGQARTVLLVTAETYSKFMHPRDRGVRTLFGDAAAATLVQGAEAGEPAIGPFVYGTDGRGAGNLIVPTGGMRQRAPTRQEISDEQGVVRTSDDLAMDGPEIFAFALATVPRAVTALLGLAGLPLECVDRFVFHQANRYMLEQLRRKLRIDPERFVVDMRDCGNTISASIPIALGRAAAGGTIRAGERVMLVGFGVGYSWGACMVRWTG